MISLTGTLPSNSGEPSVANSGGIKAVHSASDWRAWSDYCDCCFAKASTAKANADKYPHGDLNPGYWAENPAS